MTKEEKRKAREERKKAAAFNILPTMEPEEIRQAAIAYANIHRKWYWRQATIMGDRWNYLTLATIILSAISSVVTAYGTGHDYRFIPAILSALAAFCAAYLAQFRVRDLWQIREDGRISAEEFVAKAQAIDVTNTADTFSQAIALRMHLHELERDQAQQFFAVPKNHKEGRADRNCQEAKAPSPTANTSS